MPEPAIEVSHLRHAYGATPVLDDVDLAVAPGTVHALLGPNGAGKTTVVRILATLLRPTAGTARVLGHDVVAAPLAVRRRIGLAGQAAAVDQELTGRENVVQVGRLYRLDKVEARRRADAVLERFALTDVADRRVSTYSGGMRRRLDLCASLVGRPPVLLLDEPTTGLDPRTRQELWSAVDGLRREGTTVLLTTQYLEEADRLAQRIAVLDRGRVVAAGTAADLKATIGADVLVVRVADADDAAAAAEVLAPLGAEGELVLDASAREIRLPVADPARSADAVRRLDAAHIALAAIELQQPSLDDVFLALTGRRPEPAAGTPDHQEQAA